MPCAATGRAAGGTISPLFLLEGPVPDQGFWPFFFHPHGGSVRCQRCNGPFREIVVILQPGERCTSLCCAICGETIDPVILQNRTRERRVYWRRRTDLEARDLSRAEQILNQYEEAAIYLDL